MQLEKKRNFVSFLPEFFLYCFAAECTFGASGRWLEIGPLSIRMLLFILAFAATLPLVLKRLQEVVRHPAVIAALAFAVAVALSTVIGVVLNNQKHFIWADISKFLTLALLPGMLVTMNTRQKLERLLLVIFFSAVAVGLLTAGLYFVFSFVSEERILELNDWVNTYYLGGLASMKTGTQRVYLRSHVFLPFAIVYGVWLAGREKGWRKLVLEILVGMMAYALIVSMTRGLWLGMAASALLVLILQWRDRKELFKILGMAILVFAVLTGLTVICYRGPYFLVEIVNRFDPDIIHYTGRFNHVEIPDMGIIVDENNAVANEMRAESILGAWKNILHRPVIGNGLGTNLDHLRQDGSIEYMYLDLLMKMGAVGFVFFAVCFFMPCVQHLKRLWQERKEAADWNSDRTHNTFLVAAYLGTAVVSVFNPFLTNPMGITMLFTVILGVSLAKENKK